MKKIGFIFLFICTVTHFSYGQYTQIIRGRVTDINTNTPLPGAQVFIPDSVVTFGTSTDFDGYFELKNVPVGRQNLRVSFIGYSTVDLPNLYVNSGKELVLEIKLEESVTDLDEVVVNAYQKDATINEMAQISARMFTIEETERYAGSFGDPSRMASAYAGVLTMGTQTNDIVIRGNSPNSMLWQMEGLEIPNPNHFGDLSGTGGTISMLNNNVLANSDFYSAAFPAEYSNATSGVFDLNLRKGNSSKREYLAQVGMNGFELGLEGPIFNKNNSSYLANYRYSTLGVFDILGINFGVSAVPKYQDLTFNLSFPQTKAGSFKIFGITGTNGISGTENENGKTESFTSNSQMVFVGITHSFQLNKNSGIYTSVGTSYSKSQSNNKSMIEGTISDHYIGNQSENTYQFKTEYKNRINSKNLIKIGISGKQFAVEYCDSTWLQPVESYISTLDVAGQINTLQSYFQWKHRFTDDFTFVGGLNYRYVQISNENIIEPRFSLTKTFNENHSLSFGFGIHSKLQPKFIYFHKQLTDTVNLIYEEPNRNLETTKSRHFVLGYNWTLPNNKRLKIEAYYQQLYNIPVEKESSYMSLINYGTGFSEYDFSGLKNKGTGYNYGTEITFEKFFSSNFYYLATLSLFQSKYKGSDDILRNTRFNTNAIANVLGGYEFFTANKNSFGVDVRLMWSGGERKVPLNYDASQQVGYAVYDIANAYEERFADYFRLDFKVSYKINRKTTHTFAIDIMNITNRKNHFLAMYNSDINDYKEVSMLGILPSVLWRWNF